VPRYSHTLCEYVMTVRVRSVVMRAG